MRNGATTWRDHDRARNVSESRISQASEADLSGPLPMSALAWLCEKAKTLNRDRRSCSSKTVLVAHRARGFNLEIELKNIILRRVSIFEFLHMG
jgi:hypothetical protein